jgi:type I restriction enzyme S subunit
MEKQMSRYKPYPKYKESGVEWLGDVPEHWILRKLKFFARIKNGQDQKKVIQDNGKYPIYGSGGEFGRANSYLYNQVSVLLGRKGTVDKPLFIAEPFWTVDTMYFTKINSLTNPRFFYYTCLTIPFGYYQYGSALPSMTQEDLHNHHFIAPPIKEQKAIANYLDQKTKKIDTLIEKQQTLIKLLKEKRQALISHAVTKGVDIDNNTWNKYRLDWVTTIVRGNTGFKKDELLKSGKYVALQYGKTYKVDEVNKEFNFYVNDEFYKSSQVVHYANTILVSTSETIKDLGHSCFYNRNDLGLIGGEQILLKPNSKLLFGRYLYYKSKVFSNELRKYAIGLKVFRFNIDDVKSTFILIPNIEEQTKIANYLDQKTKTIDTLIEKSTQAIELLKERRTALISAVVTGKVDVRSEDDV